MVRQQKENMNDMVEPGQATGDFPLRGNLLTNKTPGIVWKKVENVVDSHSFAYIIGVLTECCLLSLVVTTVNVQPQTPKVKQIV